MNMFPQTDNKLPCEHKLGTGYRRQTCVKCGKRFRVDEVFQMAYEEGQEDGKKEGYNSALADAGKLIDDSIQCYTDMSNTTSDYSARLVLDGRVEALNELKSALDGLRKKEVKL